MAMPTGATLRQQQQQQQHHQDQQQGSGSNGLAGTSTKERLLTQGDQLGTFLLADKFSNSSSFNQHRQQQKQRQDPPQLHPEGKHFDSRGGGGIGDGSSAGGGAGAGGALFNNANVAMNTTRPRPSMRSGVQGQGGFQNDTLGPGLGASSGPGNGGSAVMGYERSGSAGSTEGSNVHGGNGGPNRTVRTAQTFRRPSLESSDGGHAGGACLSWIIRGDHPDPARLCHVACGLAGTPAGSPCHIAAPCGRGRDHCFDPSA